MQYLSHQFKRKFQLQTAHKQILPSAMAYWGWDYLKDFPLIIHNRRVHSILNNQPSDFRLFKELRQNIMTIDTGTLL